MVKIFVYTLLVIVSAVVLTLYFDLLEDPGYLLLSWRNYTFETSLFALSVFLVVAVFLLRLLIMLISVLNPLRLLRAGNTLGGKGKHKLHSRTTEGLMHFIRNDTEEAHQLLERSFNDKECSVVNYLAAAYAACDIGREDLWEEYLGQAAKRYPAALTAVNTVRAELLMKAGHLEQSLAVLEQVRKTTSKDRRLLVLLKQAYIQLEDWEHLESLLPILKKAGVVKEEELSEIEKLLFEQQLRCQAETLAGQGKTGVKNGRELLKTWNKAPQNFQEDPDLVEYFVGLLVSAGAGQEAANTIELALNRHWNERLILKYGELDSVDHSFQLTQAEDWLQQRPNDAGLLLTLGRLAMRNERWDQASDYLQASIRYQSSGEAYNELQHLENERAGLVQSGPEDDSPAD